MPDNVKRWLENLGLGKYAELFAENDIDLSVLPHIADDDLKDLGLTLGARRKIMAAVQQWPGAGNEEPSSPATTPRREGAGPPQSDPERRQLTVMFCDLVGSTALSTRLDPEDYRAVIRDYQDACAGEITRRGGYIARFMGDGLLAYFGWPQAHEDDARQAISAGLGILAAATDIATPDGEAPVAVRIGIATGPVVVGDIVGEGAAQEAEVTGETPNLASRLQELAEPNTVVVASTTHALAGGLFAYEALGSHSLKGIEGEAEVWRVVGRRRVEDRFAIRIGELTPLIGREEELEILTRRWSRARDGEGQVVLLSGEPGIGKSRLVRALREKIADEPHTRRIYQCSPHHTSSALYPVISQLEQAADIEPGDDTDARLDKLDRLLAQAGRPTEDVTSLIASLLSIPASERYPLPDLTPQQLKDRTLAALVDQLVGLTAKRPVLFVFEDAHWIDPTSLELMELVTQRIPDLPVLIIVTYRPEFAAPWVGLPDVTLLALNRLNARACTAMAEQLTGDIVLPPEFMAQLVQKTDGIPLFVEELTRSVIEAQARRNEKEALAEQDIGIVIPATLQEALEARLDRSPQIREVAQVGAAIGRKFPYDLLARVASLPSAELNAALADLTTSGLVFARGEAPDASYAFKHALVQDTAYDSMMRSKRRETHKRIAEGLLQLQPDVTATEPAALARHYTEAGLPENAVDWWTRAGQAAAARSANPEAFELLERGLSLIAKLPESEARDRRELALQATLFGPTISVKGQFSAEMEAAFTRTLELCEHVDAPDALFRALFAKSLSHGMRGQHKLFNEMANELIRRAERACDEGAILMGHRQAACSLFLLGEIVEAQEHIDFVLSTFDRERHGHIMLTYGQDPGVITQAYNGVSQWVLGWPDKARAAQERAIAEAVELDHVSTLGPVLAWGGLHAQAISRDLEGLCRNDKGFAFARASDEHWSDPELLRVRGEALAMRDGVAGNDEAEDYLRRAIEDARSRRAKSFELRAAMSLARFLRNQGRSVEGRDTGADLRLVHRGLRHARPHRRQGAAR